MVTKIDTSSFVFANKSVTVLAVIPQSSRSNSSQGADSSASCNAESNFEQNSASDRARDASRICAATDVPDRSNWCPRTWTSFRAIGSVTYNRIIAEAYCFVLRLIAFYLLQILRCQRFRISAFCCQRRQLLAVSKDEQR